MTVQLVLFVMILVVFAFITAMFHRAASAIFMFCLTQIGVALTVSYLIADLIGG